MFKAKVIRDPIHDLILIEDELTLQLIDSPEFQRLRYIRQLGFAWLVYPGAEHSRFTHSIGVYHMSKQILAKLEKLDEYEKRLVKIAALLHDVGHGPFSHLFGRWLEGTGYKYRKEHEEWSRTIITRDSRISEILDSVDSKFADSVADLLSKTPSNRTLASIVSSQFDADRFDYMLRDCHMTGVNYGKFDVSWLIQNIQLLEYARSDSEDSSISETIPVVAVHGRKGLDTVEQYLLGLFHLYQNVYYHKTVLAAECMLERLLMRAVVCIRNGAKANWDPVLKKIALNEEMSVADYQSLNDFRVLSWVMEWSESEIDLILKQLSNMLLKRQLFKAVLPKVHIQNLSDTRNQIQAELQRKHLEPDYHFQEVEPHRFAYNDYADGKRLAEHIFLLGDDGETLTFSQYANGLDLKISRRFSELKLDDHYFVVHPDLADFVRMLIRR
jgi:uncharacterized protein